MDLKDILDSLPEGNFKLVASTLELNRAHITSLEKAYCGGGSPVDTFLKNVCNRCYNKPVSELIGFLEQGDYRIVADFVKRKSKPGQTLDKYLSLKNSYELRQKIEELGNKESDECWKFIAIKYEYSTREIERIAASVRRNNMYSPTDLLFNILFMQRPNMPVLDIFNAVTDQCKKIIAQHMKNIIGVRE